MLAIAYRKLGELLENPNALRRTISSQSLHGGAKRRGAEPVQRLGGDERITRPRAPSPLKLVSRGDDIVRTARDNLQKPRLNAVTVTKLDSLVAAAANKQIDGDDVGSFTAVTPTARLGNYTQILRKVGIIADNLDGAIDEAGRRSELAYQITKQGNELKRDIEFNLVGVNAAAAAGATGTARATASLSAFIRTNTSKGSGGADPTVSSGVVNAARTDGTQRAITEALLKTVLQAVWTQGGDPKFLMVGSHVKTVVSSFSGIAAQRFQAPGDRPTTIVGAADVYMSDWGSISIVPNRFSRGRDAYVIDPDLCELATLRPMQQVELAKTGDSTKFMMLTEVGLQVNQEAGLGIVADLSTS